MLELQQHRDAPWGGWYTDEDIARVLSRAAELGIEVMPELDLPGHMAAVIRAYPQLGNPALAELPVEEWSRNNLLWPNDESFAFLEAALIRVTELFPFTTVHIGGDECHWELWEADAALMSSAAERGIGSAPQLQGEFTRFAKQVLAERGRTVAGWDELCLTPIDGDELILGWQQQAGVQRAVESGNPWVYCESGILYLNHVQADPEHEPCGMFGVITPRTVLEAPIPAGGRLRGLQASIWCEFVTDRELLMYHLFPRLLAFAERAWNGDDALEWDELRPLLEQEMAWLAANGVHGRPLG